MYYANESVLRANENCASATKHSCLIFMCRVYHSASRNRKFRQEFADIINTPSHVRHAVESRLLHIYTDYQPLIVCGHQFTHAIGLLAGKGNTFTDTLFWLELHCIAEENAVKR